MLFATRHRPAHGARGWYRAQLPPRRERGAVGRALHPRRHLPRRGVRCAHRATSSAIGLDVTDIVWRCGIAPGRLAERASPAPRCLTSRSRPLSGSRPRQRRRRPREPAHPFREQLAQPSFEYRSAVGRWLRAASPVDDHAGAGGRHVSLVEGHLADRRRLLLDPRLPARHRAARGGRGGADRDGDPRPRHACSAPSPSTRRWRSAAMPGRAPSPCWRTSSAAGRARGSSSSCWASRPPTSSSR